MTTEAPWRLRYRAGRVSRPLWARDQPDRLLYTSTAAGRSELYTWDRVTDTHRQATDRPDGTTTGQIDPSGETIWWFADERGSERGHWMVQPFTGGDPHPAAPELPPAYAVGLALGQGFAVIGSSTDDGAAVHLVREGEPLRLLYAHREAAGVAGLSPDDALICIAHSEHGDANHRALRVLDRESNVIADLWDGPGSGLRAAGWSPVPGDARLLVIHERGDLPRPLIWSLRTGDTHELVIDLPGEIDAAWYPEATALLLTHEHRGRSELYRYDLATGALTRLETEPGAISTATVRPDGEIWYGWSRSSVAPEVRTGSRTLLQPLGPPPPSGAAYAAREADGIPIFLVEPSGSRPHPTIFIIHGGPSGHDRDIYAPWVQVWLDHGYAAVLVNYRGSTGHGRAWRDALIGNPGFTELEDIARVHDWVIREGIADPKRMILSGGSWGGYLTLLGLSIQPDRWSLGIAAVPITDWFAQIEDEMEPLRRYDEALFGGIPIKQQPEPYRRASPITYIEQVQAPVMILGGANDPRCPIRPIDAYVERLRELGKPHEYVRYDAGHHSEVVDEQIRQMELRLAFAARHLGTPAPR
jgi:acetyl esterase/lipase